jgi:hypothetical protein
MSIARSCRVHTWVLLHYKIPREPSAPRVSVWRKLKRLEALLLHGAVWVLPATPQTREHFQWLAGEIGEGGGEAMLWEGRLSLPGQEDRLVLQFLETVDTGYREILTELDAENPDVGALARRFQQIQAHDYFHSDLGQQARAALLAPREGDDPCIG